MIPYEASSFTPGDGWTSIDIYFRDSRIPWTNISVVTAAEAPVQLATYIDCASSEALRDVAALVTPAEVRSCQAGADAIIGNNALRRFNVIFDHAHLKIHLRPNRYFGEPF